MPVADSGMETRVMVASTSCLKQGQAKVVRLRHPRTREPASFLHNPDSGTLCELLAFGEEHRSWLIGEKLVADGRIFLATPVHPVLLLLPYLYQAERLVPLDQLIEEAEFPATDIVLGSIKKGLEIVAERKGDADLNVWKFNQEKALAWLEERVGRVAKVLQRQAIDLTQGAVSSNFRLASPEQTYDDYRLCALGVVSEYLLPELADALQERIGVEEKKPSLGQFKRQSVGGQDGPKPKKAKHEGPAEDYTKKAVKALAKEEESAKVKALKASAKGTKSIASFFAKKT